jgi:hypothetical protein
MTPRPYTIVLDPQGFVGPASLLELIAAVEKANLEIRVEVAYRPPSPPGMAAVTWYEVVIAWVVQDLPQRVLDVVVGALVKVCVDRRRTHGRPQSIALLDRNGRLLKRVEVSAEAEVELTGPDADDEEPSRRGLPNVFVPRRRVRTAALKAKLSGLSAWRWRAAGAIRRASRGIRRRISR